MKVLYASMETAPYSKVGGLGDVAKALPEALRRLGAEVTIITPWYSSLAGKFPELQRTQVVHSASLPLGDEQVPVIWKAPLDLPPDNRMVLVDEPRYLSRERPYSAGLDPARCSQEPHSSILFSKAIAEWLRNSGERYDIVHLNEHQTALAAAFLKAVPGAPPVLMTVHNFNHQGVYGPEALGLLGVSPEASYAGGPYEFFGQVNFLKAGLWHCDLITTVSKTYRQEVMSDHQFGLGLEGFLRSRAERFVGILNGIDQREWDSTSDPNITPHFSAQKLMGKRLVKARLMSEMKMAGDVQGAPLVASVVLRLVEQKGIDLILAVADRLMERDAMLIVMGEGRGDYSSSLNRLQTRYPGRCRAILRYEEPLAHRIIAGADIFLMPSRFEPCGLTQMYSMAYGTVPVVRRTGGLADTVIDAREFPREGTGFSFGKFNADEFWTAVSASLDAYKTPKIWRSIVRRAMHRTLNWETSAREYLDFYETLARRHKLAA
jgi:starch synthase